MSVTLSPDELRALGFDPVASAKLGRAVKLTPGTPAKGRRPSKPWAPYASKWEASYAAHLDLLVRMSLQPVLGSVVSWAYEPDVLVCAGGTKYTPDFRVSFRDRPDEYHEVKGYFRPQDRVRVREALAVSPLDVVLVTRKSGRWEYKRLARSANAA